MHCTIYPEPRVVKVLKVKCVSPEAPQTLPADGEACRPFRARGRALRLAVLLLAGLAGASVARAQDAELLQPAEPAVAVEWAWIVPAEEASGGERLVDPPPSEPSPSDAPLAGSPAASSPPASSPPGSGFAERLYTGRFRFGGEVPARALRIVLPVPAGMHYLPGSATGPGVEIAYSVDGGRSFAAPEALRVMSAAPGALLRTRRARAADYTHIQWLLAGEFVPGLAGLVSFRARPAVLPLNWRRLDQS